MANTVNKAPVIRTKVKNAKRVKAAHRRIAEAAALLFSQNGFHKTSMREISEASGIELSYLYKYISSKDDILLLFYDLLFERYFKLVDDMSSDSGADPAQQLVNVIHRFIDASRGYYRQTMAAYTETRHLKAEYFAAIKVKEKRYAEAFQALIERGNETGCFTVADPLLAANFVQHLMMADIARRWAYAGERSVEQTRDQLIDFLLKALGYSGNPKELDQPVGKTTNKEISDENDEKNT